MIDDLSFVIGHWLKAEETHSLKRYHFVSHFGRVATMFFHSALELRGVVALQVIDFEVLAEPLTDVMIRTFAADITELAHGIDGGSKVAEMGGMLLGKLEMIEQMLLHILRHIV